MQTYYKQKMTKEGYAYEPVDLDEIIQESQIKGAEDLFHMIDQEGKSFKVDKFVGKLLEDYRHLVRDN